MSIEEIIQSAFPIYKLGVDAMIEKLGRYHTIYFKETVISDPSTEEQDSIHGGMKKPEYKNNSTIETTQNSKVIKGVINWSPKEFDKFNLRVEFPKGVVRLKTYISNLPDIQRSEFIVFDSNEIENIGKVRYKQIREAIPHGMGKDLYCLSYWTRI